MRLMGSPDGQRGCCSTRRSLIPGQIRRQTARLGWRAPGWLYEAVRSRVLVGLFVASCLVAACGGGGGTKSASPSSSASDKDPSGVSAETASFDLAAGPPSRYLIGLFTNDQRGVSYGSIQVQFCFLGATKATGPCQLSAPVT